MITGISFCLQLSGRSKETAVPSSRVGRLINYSGMFIVNGLNPGVFSSLSSVIMSGCV